jgi:diadenosine tetraphosphate (Ap4A) HIT family hydrolase
MAFLDIHPRNPGHTLLIPMVHATSLADLPESTGGHMFVIAISVGLAV